MKMFRHEHKGMQCVRSLAAVVQKRLNEETACWFFHEEQATLPGARGHEVRPRYAPVPFGNRHTSAAKAALLSLPNGTAEAVP